MTARWRFWIDRGGTFTDVVALDPTGVLHTHKLLSESAHHADAPLQGVRDVLGLAPDDPLPLADIAEIRMGTTVATNALLERTGAPTVLAITAGFGDALRIGNQTRPDLFALDIVRPPRIEGAVIEVPERVAADGAVVRPLDAAHTRARLLDARRAGYRAVAIALLHGDRHPAHELAVAHLAREVGFEQVSVSHEVDPAMRLVPRANTTVVDAYLSPVLRDYVDRFTTLLGPGSGARPVVSFMQSHGGLTDGTGFRGKDALLSGPAGGVVGLAAVGALEGFDTLVGFDMGGTSTDVCHHAGTLERTAEIEIGGVAVRSPAIAIHTVAAGGGSVLRFDGTRAQVGPESAGARPGPCAYGLGGPLTVTDCNVLLGRLRPEHFPSVFGADGRQPLDVAAVAQAFAALATEVETVTGRAVTPDELARGFLEVAVENMANAIRTVSVGRGIAVHDHTLVAFGGAGAQHAALVAERLGIPRVLVHPLAGVLSAFGIGVAARRHIEREGVELVLDDAHRGAIEVRFDALAARARAALVVTAGGEAAITVARRWHLRVLASDHAIAVDDAPTPELRARFLDAHRHRFGFATPDASLVVEQIEAEAVVEGALVAPGPEARAGSGRRLGSIRVGTMRGAMDARLLERDALTTDEVVSGPAVIVDPTTTTVVEPGWTARRRPSGALLLERETAVVRAHPATRGADGALDPVDLEVFHNRFMNIAEQMGVVLAQTARSVNIKERLDFSCALFDREGRLVANAPHMPVHLGSMSESVVALRRARPDLRPGDAVVTNAPYNGGTHLPDITVVRAVGAADRVDFFVAARGHHADIGGTVPGSAPTDSATILEEGVLLDGVPLVTGGRLHRDEILAALCAGPYPARDPEQNLADLEAQLAACEHGARELDRLVDEVGREVVHDAMADVQRNAAATVRRLLARLHDGEHESRTDDGTRVRVAVRVDRARERATIDFTGTSGQHPGNLNAPAAITTAAVLYVLRCLVDDEVPLNAGCLEPIDLVVPHGSILDPVAPAAVFAGNVETSQVVVDTLFAALGVMAGAQGTMNNLVFGDAQRQYYETICGGAGATATADGADAVHTHMTNSRLTDPEVLEWRFPVRVESFTIRRGSGGPGRHRGGDGVVRRLRFLAPLDVNLISDRRVVPPIGLAGGAPGAVGRNRLERAAGPLVELGGRARLRVGPGDVLEIATPGGGGFGPPAR